MLGASPIFGQSPNDFPKAQRMLPWLFDAMGIVGPPWTLRTLRAFQQWNGCSVHGHEKAGKSLETVEKTRIHNFHLHSCPETCWKSQAEFEFCSPGLFAHCSSRAALAECGNAADADGHGTDGPDGSCAKPLGYLPGR